MQRSKTGQQASANRRQMQASTTLNRRYVKRPVGTAAAATKAAAQVAVKTKKPASRISHFDTFSYDANTARAKATEEPISPAKAHPAQIAANQKMRARQQAALASPAKRPTAKELKDAAIKKALQAAEKQETTMAEQIAATGAGTKEKKMRFGAARIIFAATCAVGAIFGIVYFINLNMPDIQFRAAAVQLDASYPNYIPYNYSPSGIASENGVITIQFKKKGGEESFTVTEERSSWDSNALLNNFVKEKYGEDYTILREQGLTIYISGSDAAWVNGGIVYKLEAKKGTLSKKQISDLAVSF